MDITSFMSWWIQQVVSIFSYTYNLLDSITFANTSLLKVIIFINVIVPFLYVIITIPRNNSSIREVGENSARRDEFKKNNDAIWWEDTKGRRHYK